MRERKKREGRANCLQERSFLEATRDRSRRFSFSPFFQPRPLLLRLTPLPFPASSSSTDPPSLPSPTLRQNRISLAWIVPAYECAKLLRTLPAPAPLPAAASPTSTSPALPPKHPHLSPEQSAAVRRFATLFVAVAAFSALSPVADALLFWLPLYEVRFFL